MADAADYRFYADLAPWWPLISTPAHYEEEAAFSASLLATADGGTTRVLELGSGGGNNASHLKKSFTMTLVDRSPSMLAVSRALNPECEHVEGDMRTVRLGRTFDAVFVHDAIDYMTTEHDLRRAVETAFVHCREGGVAVFIPDHTTETFEPDTGHGGSDGEDGRGVRYLSWTRLESGTVATDYVFVLRDRHGEVGIVHEEHRTGLFSIETWLRVLAEVGFEPHAVEEETTEDRTPRQCFVARRATRRVAP
ncbi:MAG TPA: class I SAM-dependent methyltransferase [Acidimicrobiales bacterium]|nr:class I SAM-dependent methyltransferase [Acidimicrobiales bacterium]